MENRRYQNDVDRIFHQWHDLAPGGDAGARANLYSDNTVFESPLVLHSLQRDDGAVRGKADLLRFFNAGQVRRPDAQFHWYRTGQYLTDGQMLFWEYPRQTPNGNQIDIAEVMEVRDGKIQAHRVYWGWYGVRHLFGSGARKP